MSFPGISTIPVTIYGYSDDVLSLQTPSRSIYDEFDCCNTCLIMLTAPNGETFKVYAAYGESPISDWIVQPWGDDNANWRWESIENPDNDDDPAIVVYVPAGTIVERIDGED